MISLIRYPGSKAKLTRQILKRFPFQMVTPLAAHINTWEYREPFFGSGAVGFEAMLTLPRECRVWVNDIDPGMVALWQTIRERPDALIDLCERFKPSVEWFYQLKEEDGAIIDPVRMAFRKLALHRMSFSGLGAMAGGPIGGRNQSSEYNVHCRWNPYQIMRNVRRIHKIMRGFEYLRITCGDFQPLIESATDSTFIYLDPPYYEKGEQLYKYNTTEADHVRLAGLLMNTPANWLLSYDDHPRVRELYAGCNIDPVYATYTTATKRGGSRPKNGELVISRKQDTELAVPA